MQNSKKLFQNNMHNDTFWQSAKEMREKEKHCDFTVKSNDGKKFNVHKIIFATMSPYFDALFNGEMRENSESSVSFSDIDSTILNEIVNYMYTGKIQISDDNVELLLDAANYFQIEWIVEKCEEYLKEILNYINCWHLYKFADAHSRKGFMEDCRHYMAQYFEEFVLQKTFLEMTFDEFNDLISKCLVFTESTVFTAVIDWVKHKIDDRKIHLQSLLSQVNLARIGANFLLQYIVKESILQNDVFFKDHLRNAIKGQLYLDKNNLQNTGRTKLKWRQIIFIPTKNDCAMYNLPVCNVFTMPPMAEKREQFGIVSAKKKIFVLGGKNDDKTTLKSAQVFDPFTQLWTSINDMPSERYAFGVCALDDFIYVCGGSQTYTEFNSHYNLSYNTGYNQICTTRNISNMHIYNLEICKWVSGIQMNAVGYMKSVSLSNSIYCVGLNTAHKFDPRVGKIQELCPFDLTETEFCLVSDNNWCIYKIGKNDNFIYDIRNDQWTKLPDLNLPRTKHGAATLDGYVYVFGGQCKTENDFATSVEIYDPKENTWVTSESITITCNDASSAVLYIP